jgi:GNAT superfamily N-acetyltransferase
MSPTISVCRVGSFTVRCATADDGVEIAALHKVINGWQYEQGQVPTRVVEQDRSDLLDVAGHYGRRGGVFFVVTNVPGDVVGMLGVQNGPGPVARLRRFAVLPRLHRRGIGSGLVAAAVEWTRSAVGIDALVLNTGRAEHARGIYERAGFHVIGDEYHEGDDSQFVDNVMFLDLRQPPAITGAASVAASAA